VSGDPAPDGRDVAFRREVPQGDDRERLVCQSCGFIHYQNPLVVVGSVTTSGDRVLLCRRAIEPRDGYWTIPAGYLELGESAEDGARREAVEEANARIEIDALLGVYSIPHVNQVQLIYRARLASPDISPGPESREVRLFGWDEIPWSELAFPSVHWSLRHHREVDGIGTFAPFTAPGPERWRPDPIQEGGA